MSKKEENKVFFRQIQQLRGSARVMTGHAILSDFVLKVMYFPLSGL